MVQIIKFFFFKKTTFESMQRSHSFVVSLREKKLQHWVRPLGFQHFSSFFLFQTKEIPDNFSFLFNSGKYPHGISFRSFGISTSEKITAFTS